MSRLLCYECDQESDVANSSESVMRCPQCNSEFTEVLSGSRQGTHQSPQSPVDPPASQQQTSPHDRPDTPMNEGPTEPGGGTEGDNAANTTRFSNTTRFAMPNGHSFEFNFVTHVLQPGADFQPGTPPTGIMPHQDGATSQMYVVLGNNGGAPGTASNEALAALFANAGATPGNNTRFSPADFGMGQTFESLLAQLAELHQTREQPTAVAFRESLPRLKVAAGGTPNPATEPATAADQSVSAPEGVACCRAGDTCCVCRNEFTEGAEVVQLPCDHCFDESCIMPWLEMHSTCPVCRRKLPHEDPPPQQPVAEPEAAADDGPARVIHHRTRSSTRLAAQDSQHATGRRVGSNGPQEVGSTAAPGVSRTAAAAGLEDANVNMAAMATMVRQQLASLVTGQLGQMGFAVPPDLAQQLQHAQGDPSQPQLLHVRMPLTATAHSAAPNQSDAQQQAEAATRARQSERQNIETHVMELRRLQALHLQCQAPATEAQFRQQMAELRLLGATLQDRLALVDTSYSAGSRQHARLQTRVQAMREDVASLRRQEQQGETPGGGQPRSHPSALQTALVRLLAFEDSLATAAGQLNVCRQSRQGLRRNQLLINRHIASFDASDGLRPQGQTSAPNHSHQHPHAHAAPCGGSADSTEAAINGSSGDADHPPTSVIRPASSPAEGDGCGDDHNRRRVRARTEQGQSSLHQAAADSPHMTFVLGRGPPASAPSQRHPQSSDAQATQMAIPSTEAEPMVVPTDGSSAAMSQDEAQSVDGSRRAANATVRPFHSSAPAHTPAVPASRVSQGFSLPLHAVPGAFGRLLGSLRGMFGRR